MGIRSRRRTAHDLERCRIDNRQRVVAFLKNEQGRGRRLRTDAAGGYEERCEQEAEASENPI